MSFTVVSTDDKTGIPVTLHVPDDGCLVITDGRCQVTEGCLSPDGTLSLTLTGCTTEPPFQHAFGPQGPTL